MRWRIIRIDSENAFGDLIGYPVDPTVADEQVDILSSFPQFREDGRVS